MLRLTPFDTSTEEGRSKERYRRVAFTTLASAAARGINVITLLISVPLTLHYLGPERYGMWMTVSSLIAILSFMDLGMGNGLMNAISEAHGRNDRLAAARYISSAFLMLSAVAFVLAVLFLTVYPFVTWQAVFKVSSPLAVAEAGPSVLVFAACFLLSLPAAVVQRIQMGYQEGFSSSLWSAFGSLLGLGGVLVGVENEAGLPWLILAMSGGPLVATLFNALVLFGMQHPWLRPSWRSATLSAAHQLFRTGILFLILQFAGAVAYSSDNIIAAQVLGPEAVAEYSVPLRMFSIAPLLLGIILGPLWPAYGEAVTRGDIAWVKSAFLRSLLLALFLTGPVSIVLAITGGRLIQLWVGSSVTPSVSLLLGLAIWTVLSALGSAVGIFLNGISVVRFQAICAMLMAGAAIVVKVILAHTIGLPGIVWGSIIAYLIFTGIPISVYLFRLLPQLDTNSSTAWKAQKLW